MLWSRGLSFLGFLLPVQFAQALCRIGQCSGTAQGVADQGLRFALQVADDMALGMVDGHAFADGGNCCQRFYGQVSGRGGLTHWLVFMKPRPTGHKEST